MKRFILSLAGLLAAIVSGAQIAPPVQTDTLIVTSVKYNFADIYRENWPADVIYKSTTEFIIGKDRFKIKKVVDSSLELHFYVTDVLDGRDKMYMLSFREYSKDNVTVEFSGYEFKCRYKPVAKAATGSGDGVSLDLPEDGAFPFQEVDEKPSFMGGDANAFSRWVNERLIYPEIAKNNGAQGCVTLQFTVNADGTVSDVKVIRGVEPSLDKEAVRVVSKSPKWIPGKKDGRYVRVTYTFPVIFQLR
ncbi:MAG: energy transducer TonB [Bacteroidales bacterium]|nr:energy transducer TonB [Bacteroidales bacterium]